MRYRSISDVVRRQSPASLPLTATVQDACRVMRDQRIGAVLVIDPDQQLAGIFTGRDAVGRVLAEAKDPTTTTLAMVMTPEPDTVDPQNTAIDALRMMEDGGYRHLPVVQGKTIMGIVSLVDFEGLEIARLDEETGFWEIL